METDYASLHNISDYSILNSLASPSDFFNQAKKLGIKALAITDNGTLSSVFDSYKAAKSAGIQYIVGCNCYFINENDPSSLRRIVLLAKNAKGYENLLQMNIRGYDFPFRTSKKSFPVINWELLEKYSSGLICLTGCGNGIISQLLMQKNNAKAEEELNRLKSLFNEDLYVEVQANNMKRFSVGFNGEIDQQFINRQLINLANKLEVKIVPTSNSLYLTKEDSEIHDVELCIASGQPKHSNYRLKYGVSDFYLKPKEDIHSFFSRNYGEEFSETIIKNTVEVASKCESPEWIFPKTSNPSGKELPDFDCKLEKDYDKFIEWKSKLGNDIKDLEEDKLFLRYRAEIGFNQKCGHFVGDKRKEYLNRIEKELDVFYSCGISSYMLIVADFLNWCKNNQISIGPGRGSVGGSLIGYLLGIHEADSIKYGLVFERFFNKLKTSYADVDSDVSKKHRNEVINYLSNKYGSDRTSQISNIIWQSPKVYVKDICRTFELGGSKEAAVDLGNIISGCISNDASSIKAAKEASPLLCAHIDDFPEIEKCSIIEQKPRAFGTHAAGVIIGKRSLEKIVPLRKDVDGSVVLEVDKDYAEDIGLVKMDVLGLSTLDIIDNTYRLIQRAGKKIPVIDKEKYDKKTYDLISSGNTFGVFQFGTSAGTIDLCKKIKPKSIEDLAIITTIARPSSKDIREDFILRKMGKREITYPHPKLENALKNSFGHCIYDESLLILANDVAGWDLNEADKLRKLTKEKGKNPEKVKKWRQEFIDNSVANNVTEEDAIFIWDSVIQNFAKYSFNKSHAVLYSFVSYITAYLKAHYPVEFLLANLMQEIESNTQDSSDNILRIKSELRNYGLTIKQPDINLSEKDYNIIGDNLITGLSGIKFLGEDAIEDILKKRPFTSLIDFFDRVDSSKVRANSIQALVACGAFDCFNETRKNMFQYCSDIRKNLTTYKRKNLESAIGKTDFNIEFPNKEEEWALRDLYALEMKYIGEAFICKPAKAYKSFFNKEFCKISDILKMKDKSSISSFKFILKDFVELKVKKETSKYYGQSMIKANIEDSNQDNISLTIFPDKYRELLAKLNKKNISALEAGQAFHISCNINTYENEVGLIYNDIYELELPPDVPSDSKTKKVFRKTKKTIKEEIIDELHKDNVILEIKD